MSPRQDRPWLHVYPGRWARGDVVKPAKGVLTTNVVLHSPTTLSITVTHHDPSVLDAIRKLAEASGARVSTDKAPEEHS